MINFTSNISKLLLFLILINLSGCSSFESPPQTTPYAGTNLNIGVIGNHPTIVEENLITFKRISFYDLKKRNLSVDAVIITKDNLHEASMDEYKDAYNNSQLPFFFIGTDSSLPFTESDYPYVEKDFEKGTSYAVGFVGFGDGGFNDHQYGLYNDVENQKNLLDMYSSIFRTIEEYKSHP